VKTWRQRRGRTAEDRALAAARERGLACLARNFTSRGGELDLVLREGEELVIAEVRYRDRDDFGNAAASVNFAKRRRIIAATRYFLATHPEHAERPLRFDVVGVGPGERLEWIEAAFDADD
jgi:putative endonuclease